MPTRLLAIAIAAAALAGCGSADVSRTETGYRAEKRVVGHIPRDQALRAIRERFPNPLLGITYELHDDAIIHTREPGVKATYSWRDMNPRVAQALERFWVFYYPAGNEGWAVATEEDGEVVVDAIESLKVEPPSAPEAAAPLACPKCGAAYSKGERFCEQDGAPLAPR